MAASRIPTVWVLGDQLDRGRGALGRFGPDECRVLIVESQQLVGSKRWHRQRLHLVLSAMAHFAQELRDAGYEVDHRRANNLIEGLRAHRSEFGAERVVASDPMSWAAREMFERTGVETFPCERFLCSSGQFAEWAEGRGHLRMEDFYRWQRTRLGVLLEPDGEPVGGEWNYDRSNREPPPGDDRTWPGITRFELDEIDREVLRRLPGNVFGSEPDGSWPVTRTQAVQRLGEFVQEGLAPFGPHEDAMLAGEWKLAHSALSSSMNLGLLHPGEVVEAAEAAYRRGEAPINSVEGFIRQVIGWREYVWGVYWLWMPDYRDSNELRADLPVPPVLDEGAGTDMRCVRSVVGHVHDHGYAHHIERLMVLGNLALTAGVDPWAMTEWMWAGFVDSAEWVMLPNVVGMALFADGGMMATKPYAAGGNYINRMSDFCGGCRFDHRKRTGEDACPFTTLYWDFLARNEERLSGNHRLSRQLASMRRLSDLAAVRERAEEVLSLLRRGDL
ncbi:MAG: cryptochrome/photolyase family protein [Microthrixaceae bacterium]